MLSPLCAFGHIASYAELLESFHGQTSAILPFRRVRGGLVNHLRSNVFICTHLDDEERAAARVGGLLDCTTVLKRRGILDEPGGDGCLHLRLRRNDGRASARRWNEPRQIRAHWQPPRWGPPSLNEIGLAFRQSTPPHQVLLTRLELPVKEALRMALSSCLDSVEAPAVIARILATPTGANAGVGLLGVDELAQVVVRTPRFVKARLRKTGIPESLDDAIRALERGNLFDEW